MSLLFGAIASAVLECGFAGGEGEVSLGSRGSAGGMDGERENNDQNVDFSEL